MIRTIKFRAKSTLSNNWIEGDLVQKLDRKYISIGGVDSYEVDASTISQYVGITDINNNYVYENDVILFEDKRYKVVWSAKCFGYYLSKLYDDSMNMMTLAELNGKPFVLERCIDKGGE